MQLTSGRIREDKTEASSFGVSDSDIIIRMLYFCESSPRVKSQIMSYCQIDAYQFKKFMTHCLNRRLLRISIDRSGYGDVEQFVMSDHGRDVLRKTELIKRELGFEGQDNDSSFDSTRSLKYDSDFLR